MNDMKHTGWVFKIYLAKEISLYTVVECTIIKRKKNTGFLPGKIQNPHENKVAKN